MSNRKVSNDWDFSYSDAACCEDSNLPYRFIICPIKMHKDQTDSCLFKY